MKSKILFLLMFSFPCVIFSQTNQPKTPNEVVTLIKKNVTCDWAKETVDKFKAGDPETKLKGIAVCMFADMVTLREAVKQNCNFIITHEPIFYSHLDETEEFKKRSGLSGKNEIHNRKQFGCLPFSRPYPPYRT